MVHRLRLRLIKDFIHQDRQWVIHLYLHCRHRLFRVSQLYIVDVGQMWRRLIRLQCQPRESVWRLMTILQVGVEHSVAVVLHQRWSLLMLQGYHILTLLLYQYQ